MISLQIDFYSEFIRESIQFYDDPRIYKQKEEFNLWVKNNFQWFITINDFNEVVPSQKIMEEIKGTSYIHKSSNCHYSARSLCLLLRNCEYVTGFIRCDDLEFPIITHSFNLLNEKLMDISRLDENFNTIKANYYQLPHEYFGIVIPKPFVSIYMMDPLLIDPEKPLLYEWFFKQTQT